VESSSVRVLVALVKAERKCAAALENVAEFPKKKKEHSDALFTQAKQEMEEARKKLAEAEQAKRLLLSKNVVNPNFHS
jgi:flagellar biosynthesis chaperone FliJ